MNRLWVRLAVLVTSVLFSVFLLQFVSIVTDPDAPGDGHSGGPSRAQIADRLGHFMLLSLVVGLAGGVGVSLVVTRPLGRLSRAVDRLGPGDLSVRVPISGPEEVRALARQFNGLAQRLQEAEFLRRDLLADISHELRTPLATLDASLRAAVDAVHPLTDMDLAALWRQTRTLVTLVHDLRELSLAEAGALPLALVAFDPALLCHQVALDMTPGAADRGQSLVAQAPALASGAARRALGDPLRVRQILVNLTANALRHSPDGSVVHFEVEPAGAVVQICVVDRGEGMEGTRLDRIFERFYRADPSRDKHTGGTGLGLSVSRALARAMGGDLQAASNGPGKGCRFTLTLPESLEPVP